MTKKNPSRFSPDFLSDLKRTIPIVDVVESYTHVSLQGNVFFGLCPFHDEKTGSLSVNPDLGLFHCFGCGAGGDVISFIQEIDGVSFVDAVTSLADQYGIALPCHDSGNDQVYRKSGTKITADTSFEAPISLLYRVMASAGAFYRGTCNEAVTSYLIGRGVKPDIIEEFNIGLSVNSTGIIDHLGKQGFSVDAMIDAGVVYRDKSGSLRDRMAGRIVFPICDTRGRTIAFAGRINPLSPSNSSGMDAKYVNTPNTRIYRKGSCLFGVSQARKLAVSQARVCVTEGYLDVLTLMSHDFPAVAVCGTSFSAEHMTIVKRLLHGSDMSGDYQTILLFDFDAAGIKANSKALDTVLDCDQGFLAHLQVAHLASGDPAEAIVKDVHSVDNAITSARAIVSWSIHQVMSRFNVFRADQRMEAAKEIAGILGRVSDGYVRKSYASDVSWLLNIPDDIVFSLVAAEYKNGYNRKRYAEQRQLRQQEENSNPKGEVEVDGNVKENGNSKPHVEVEGNRVEDMTRDNNEPNGKVEVESIEGMENSENAHAIDIITKLNTVATKNARVAFEKNLTVLTLKYPNQIGTDYDHIVELSYPLFQDIKTRIEKLGGAASSWTHYRSQTDWLTAIAHGDVNSDIDTNLGANSKISPQVFDEVLRAIITIPDPVDAEKYTIPGFVKKMALGFSCKELLNETELELRHCDPIKDEEHYNDLIEDLESLKICLEDARIFISQVHCDYLEKNRRAEKK